MFTPKHAGAVNEIYGPTRFVNNEVFLTKGSELGVCIRLRGIDSDWMTDEMLERQHADLAAAVRSIPEGFRIHQYLIKNAGADLPEHVKHKNPIVRETSARRLDHLAKTQSFSSINLYLALVYEPQTLRRRLRLTTDKLVYSRQKVAADAEYVLGIARTFILKTSALLGSELLSKSETFTFLRYLQSLDWETARQEQLSYIDNVDFWLTSKFMSVNPNGIAIDGKPLTVMTLRGLPQSTWATLLREALSIKGSFLVTTQFSRRSNNSVSQLIAKQQDHYKHTQWIRDPRTLLALILSRGRKENIVADQGALDRISELSGTLGRLNQGDDMGDFSLTAVSWDASLERANVTATQLETIFSRSQGSLIRETYWAPGAFADIMPGTTPNWDFRQRQHLLPLSQYVDLSLFYNHDQGEKQSRHLGSEHLLPLRTVDDTVHYLNLHQDDRMGLLMFGIQGSGKSVLANLCIDHSMKYDPETLILDGLGGSYRTLTRKHGGSYFELNPDGDWPFTLNPCALPDSRSLRQHLSMLVRLCLTSGGLRLNARRNQEIFNAVVRMLSLPVSQRRFGAIELVGELASYFEPWVGDGQYGFVFDNPEDSFALSRLQTIDFSAMDAYPDVLQPLLFHFFYLWGTVVNDPAKLTTLKQMYVDEGWKMISYKAARRYIQTAARTWRKRNGGVALVTQSVVELRDAKMLDIVNELCPTKLLLANPGADYAEYARIFHLNNKEIQNYMSLRGKGDVMWKVGGHSKVLHVDVDPESLWTYAASPQETFRRDAAIREFGFDAGLKKLAAGAA